MKARTWIDRQGKVAKKIIEAYFKQQLTWVVLAALYKSLFDTHLIATLEFICVFFCFGTINLVGTF